MVLLGTKENPIYKMSVAKIREKCDPFVNCCWADIDSPITINEVSNCNLADTLDSPSPRQRHIDIIAKFVHCGWDNPIEIDVGVPSLGFSPSWIILDGNHRFAAAIVRKDKIIAVSASGVTNAIEALC